MVKKVKIWNAATFISDQSQYLARQWHNTRQTIVFSCISTLIFQVITKQFKALYISEFVRKFDNSEEKKMFTHENTVARSPMKATEKHFDLLRKTQVITKVSQNAAWIWTFFTKKSYNWKFLEKINVSRWEDCSAMLTDTLQCY